MNLMHPLPDSYLALIRMSLDEDIATGDVTSNCFVPHDKLIKAKIISRDKHIVCGGQIATDVFHTLDPELDVQIDIEDGQEVVQNQTILRLLGNARSILTAERTALNFMQRLTGIASMTHQYVQAVEGFNVRILDTRKTTPGYRALEKYAVRCGGGHNHRMGLYDRVMLKDNHRVMLGKTTLAEAVIFSRQHHPDIPVQVEVESIEQFQDALSASPDWILLDNMDKESMEACVKLRTGETLLEASGGITLSTIRDIASTGVDAISVGALTHSAPASDLSLEVDIS